MKKRSAGGVAVVAWVTAGVLAAVPAGGQVNFAASRFDDPVPDGCAPGDCSLREAIMAANTTPGPDEVVVRAGTYLLSLVGNGPAAGDLDITDPVEILGAGPASTIVDASAAGERVLEPEADGLVSISGLTIQGGTDSSPGGGGGLYSGGLSGVETTLLLTNVVLAGNTAGAGGGLVNFGIAHLTNVTVTGNTATSFAAGLYNGFDDTMTLTNVTVSGNASRGNGGGVWNDGVASLNNVTVTSNTADSDADGAGDGGGVQNAGGPGNVTSVKNSVIAGNVDGSPGAEAPDCTGTLTSQGHNLIGNPAGCTINGDTTGNLLGSGPLLGALSDNGGPTPTHALAKASPAIDAGGGDCAAADQRGAPRGACDMGAYELVRCQKVVVNRVGTTGKDDLAGTGGRDGVLSLAGNDRLKGKGGADALCGGPGKDVLKGGGGKDRLSGGPGKDECMGQAAKDRARGCERERSIA